MFKPSLGVANGHTDNNNIRLLTLDLLLFLFFFTKMCLKVCDIFRKKNFTYFKMTQEIRMHNSSLYLFIFILF